LIILESGLKMWDLVEEICDRASHNGMKGKEFFWVYKRCIKEFDGIRGKRYCVGVVQKAL